MSVDIATFVKVLQANRLRLKYAGLSGFHANLGEALARDNQFMEQLVQGEIDYLTEQAEEEGEPLGADYFWNYDWCHLVDWIRSEDGWGGYVQDYPVEEVYDPAAQMGVPVEDVWFFCPGGFGALGCAQPIQYEPDYGTHYNRYYCGCCGTSAQLEDGQHLGLLLSDFGSRQWTFVEGEDVPESADSGLTFEAALRADRHPVWVVSAEYPDGRLHLRS